jgi:DNA-binding LytR/AlgR family response regulator
MMPGLNGIETMQRLTAIDPRAHIVISSGFDRVEVLARFDLGDYDHDKVHFLNKPFTIATLVGMVERCQRDLPN